ncbi:MAG TPA: hypothetical protein VK007_10680 [Acidimicrobiales bacterium]|nr:hypothetical protein [Acidimicrobiales bacterium]
MTVRASRRLVAATAAALLLAAAACSDDDDGGAPATADDAASVDDAGAGDGAAEDDDQDAPIGIAEDGTLDLPEGEDGRIFGVDDEGLARSMKAGTGADRVEVDGSTFRLIFDEGSVDSVSVTINCIAMQSVKGDDDSVVLVYPDGEVACDDH